MGSIRKQAARGQRVIPARAKGTRYEYRYPMLEAALADAFR
jgi:NAD dependent epimerase/dehydratase family enzyme